MDAGGFLLTGRSRHTYLFWFWGENDDQVETTEERLSIDVYPQHLLSCTQLFGPGQDDKGSVTLARISDLFLLHFHLAMLYLGGQLGRPEDWLLKNLYNLLHRL